MNTANTITQQPDIHFHFPFEDSMSDFEDDYPGEYDQDDSPWIGNILIDTATQALQEAFRELQPLLRKYPIDSITVDFFMLGEQGVGANMSGSRSTTSNHISMGFMPGMMTELLTRHWYPACKTSEYTNLSIHHELVHAMDYKMKPWFFSRNYSNMQPIGHLINLLITYRLESLSCLVSFLRGIGCEKSMRKARLLLTKSLNQLIHHGHATDQHWKETETLLDRVAKNAYQLGPLMMLHVLRVKSRRQENQPLETLVTKAIQLTPLTDAEIITILDAGLQIDLLEYLVTLTAPAPDGEPFVSRDLLMQLFEIFNGWHITHTHDDKPLNDVHQDILETEIKLKDLNEPDPEDYQFQKTSLEHMLDVFHEHLEFIKQCDDFATGYMASPPAS